MIYKQTFTGHHKRRVLSVHKMMTIIIQRNVLISDCEKLRNKIGIHIYRRMKMNDY